MKSCLLAASASSLPSYSCLFSFPFLSSVLYRYLLLMLLSPWHPLLLCKLLLKRAKQRYIVFRCNLSGYCFAQMCYNFTELTREFELQVILQVYKILLSLLPGLDKCKELVRQDKAHEWLLPLRVYVSKFCFNSDLVSVEMLFNFQLMGMSEIFLSLRNKYWVSFLVLFACFRI